MGHVDARVLKGAPAPVLSVHRAQDERESRILSHRRHKLEAFFMPEQVETEYLLRYSVTRGRYPLTNSLLLDHYEVLFKTHVEVPSFFV